MMRLNVPLVPKKTGGPLRVLLIGRVSTPHQQESNIEAGYEYARQYLKGIYDGPLEIKELGERGSGMLVERETILEAVAEIATRQWDLVLMEDVSKSYRNPRWIFAFVQDAVDEETRVIAPGDALDTADENWEVVLGTAAMRHGLHIPDTRQRVRRTAHYAFHHGGMVQKVRFGYRKLTPEEADSGQFGPRGLRIAKVPEHTPTIREIRQRVLREEAYEHIADWLNESGIKPGPYVKSGQWTGRLVADLLRDPILSGTRTYRDTIYQPVYSTGKHRRRKNPDGPEEALIPELAHMTPEEQQSLWAAMNARKDGHGQKGGRENPLYGRPRGRSIWPAQHICCAICGEPLHRTGDDKLKCSYAFANGEGRCWNHVQVKAEAVRAAVLPLVLAELEQLPAFREVLIDSAWSEFERCMRVGQKRSREVDREIERLERERKNLSRAIRQGGRLQALLDELAEVEAELKRARRRRAKQEQASGGTRFLTREQVEGQLEEAILELARHSFEFTVLMRTFIPRLEIRPVQALDTPQVRPRVKLTLRVHLDDQEMESGDTPHGGTTHEVQLTADPFDPPEHIEHLERCRRAKAEAPRASLEQLGAQLGLNRMTVKRALDYARRMDRQGLSEPYRELTDRPERASRWKPRAPRDEGPRG